MAAKDGADNVDESRRPPQASRSGLLRMRDAIRANPAGGLTLKIVVGMAGAALVGGGLLLVPLPGPGWVIVFAGLAILATEFAWAARALGFARGTLSSWTRWLMRQGWTVRILVSVVTLACAAVIVWLMVKLTFGIDVVAEVRGFIIGPRVR
jgi:uncharacterized protein (TIGR02611 family)